MYTEVLSEIFWCKNSYLDVINFLYKDILLFIGTSDLVSAVLLLNLGISLFN